MSDFICVNIVKGGLVNAYNKTINYAPMQLSEAAGEVSGYKNFSSQLPGLP